MLIYYISERWETLVLEGKSMQSLINLHFRKILLETWRLHALDYGSNFAKYQSNTVPGNGDIVKSHYAGYEKYTHMVKKIRKGCGESQLLRYWLGFNKKLRTLSYISYEADKCLKATQGLQIRSDEFGSY